MFRGAIQKNVFHYFRKLGPTSIRVFNLKTADLTAPPPQVSWNKHLKKSNAACFYTPLLFKLLTIVQMWNNHEEGN